MVLDASAILAYVHNETGSEVVGSAIDGGLVSTVNWSEVLQKAIQLDIDTIGMRDDFASIGLQFVAFDIAQAEIAGAIWSQTRHYGLSLADRACLALAMHQQVAVLTTDRAWDHLDLDVDIQMLR